MEDNSDATAFGDNNYEATAEKETFGATSLSSEAMTAPLLETLRDTGEECSLAVSRCTHEWNRFWSLNIERPQVNDRQNKCKQLPDNKILRHPIWCPMN